MTSLSGNFEASNPDNILDLINGGFLIIGHLDQIDDFSGCHGIMDADICFKISALVYPNLLPIDTENDNPIQSIRHKPFIIFPTKPKNIVFLNLSNLKNDRFVS